MRIAADRFGFNALFSERPDNERRLHFSRHSRENFNINIVVHGNRS